MKLINLKVGSLQTNCYLVSDESGQSVIVDPGDEAWVIIRKIEEQKLKPLYIISTHAHPDHFEAAPELKGHFSIPILMGKEEQGFLAPLFDYFRMPHFKPDAWLKEGEDFICGDLSFKILHTPGHSPGGICLYLEKEKVLFSGDTLFAGDVGRFDLPGGSEKALKQSVRDKLFVLPDESVVFPGHGSSSTIGREKELLEQYINER